MARPRGRIPFTCPTCGKRCANDYTQLPKYQVHDLLSDLKRQIQHVDAKAQAAVITIGELTKELKELQAEQRRTQYKIMKGLAFILQLLDDKEAVEYAKAIVNDYRYTRNNPK